MNLPEKPPQREEGVGKNSREEVNYSSPRGGNLVKKNREDSGKKIKGGELKIRERKEKGGNQ